MEESPAQDQQPASIEWTASEFIAHSKSANWYFALAGVALLVAASIYLITKDFISVAVVLVGALLLGVYGAREPRQLQYRLDGQGLSIGNKYYSYHDFRSFALIPEGVFTSITLMPLKRFSPPLSIYYAPGDEEKIMAILGRELPLEPQRRDVIESFMRKIRF
jgi:hypothetical protein